MAGYAARVRKDIGRWVEAGLIDARTGGLLADDVEAHDRRSFSFGTILAIMAALLVGAAILVFVAANWDGIPRIGRVAAIFGVIAAGYVGGALLKAVDHRALGEALWLIAAAAFGGAIALIGQMYHLSGDENQAILVWCLGTIAAAAMLRSGVLTMAAVGLAVAWMVLGGVDFWRHTPVPHLFVPLAAVLWGVSWWTGSAAARHLILLGLLFYAVLLMGEFDVPPVAMALAALAVAIGALCALAPAGVERAARLDGLLPVHALLAFLVAMMALQVDIEDRGHAGFALAAAGTFAGIAAAVLLFGRESRGLRWIAYTGFGAELCLVYAVMVGSMLGTAGFFLAAGLALGLMAFLIIRIEKRLGGAGRAA